MVLGWRRRLREKIRAYGGEASRPACDSFRPTLLAALLTILRAATWPMAMWALGAWLTAADNAAQNVLTDALGRSLRVMATFFFMLELVWETCRPNGLAESHFRWPTTALRIARRQIFWLVVLMVPTGLVAGTMHRQPNTAWENSLGRFALFAAMAALAVFSMRLLRPSNGLLTDFLRRNRGGWLDRLSFLWHSLAVLIPPTLIVVSAIGYHNTAIELLRHILQSVALIIFVALANGLLMRWLYLAQRRLSREQLRQRRLAYEQKLASGEQTTGDAPAPPEEELLDISAVGSQTRQLVRGATLFTLLLGLWAIWATVLPAIAILDTFELPWRAAGDAIAGGIAADGTPVMVYPMTTLKDLLLAVVIVVMTVIVGRNIPGLLEISVLQRLPLDRGSQFAISSIVRYAITIIGFVIALGMVGLTWAKVQWLAAAVTVGLGFGLQEIFGNFVSGLIILFERPIRVGDTVTVGNVHGTVTRIRIRATTIYGLGSQEDGHPEQGVHHRGDHQLDAVGPDPQGRRTRRHRLWLGYGPRRETPAAGGTGQPHRSRRTAPDGRVRQVRGQRTGVQPAGVHPEYRQPLQGASRDSHGDRPGVPKGRHRDRVPPAGHTRAIDHGRRERHQ